MAVVPADRGESPRTRPGRVAIQHTTAPVPRRQAGIGGHGTCRFFSRFAPTPPRRLPEAVKPLYIRPLGARRPTLTNRSPTLFTKEPLGAARATRANALPGARSAPSSCRAVGESTFEIWLARSSRRRWDGACSLLDGPARKRSWVSERYASVSSAAPVRLRRRRARRVLQRARSRDEHSRATSIPSQHRARLDFNPRYSFDQFIIGDGNRLAHAAALAVAETPGDAHNPLFLYAPPGLGKTHLLHAIGNYLLPSAPATTVRYTTVEAFTNRLHRRAQRPRRVERFKHAYRDADVLLIDDVQFLASKAKTEEEFFHTFNALYDSGRQLVLTCDRLPRQLTAIEERLRDRFESGLVAEHAPAGPRHPGRDPPQAGRARPASRSPTTRRPRADRRARHRQHPLPGGRLIRIVAYHSLTGRPIDLSSRPRCSTQHPPRARTAGGPPIVAADPGGRRRALRPHD